MKYILSILPLIICSLACCQNAKIRGNIKNPYDNEVMDGVTLILKKDSVVVTGTVTDLLGNYSMQKINPGIYTLCLNKIGFRDEKIDTVAVGTDSIITMNIVFPTPCQPVKKSRTPICVGGHSDHIIPIVYGFPNAKMMRRAKKNKIYLGGCIKYGCDPFYYCTIHKKKLY